jgi:Fe-S cluster biosynthesis and repair protein YggX
MGEKPLGGKLGTLIQENVCPRCWEEWDHYQVILLNEYRLNLAIPQHYEALIQEMKRFFLLETPEGGSER